ncbi:MAG TPA: hypothetical protein VGF99_19955 [Myxococcota bacterium]
MSDTPSPELQKLMDEHRAKRDAGRGQLYALEIPTSVITGCVLGKLVDDHFHVAPWGFVVGLVAGLGNAVRAVVNIIRWQKTLPGSNDTPIDTDDLSKSPIERERGEEQR